MSSLGVVAGDAGNTVTVFDYDTDQVLGSVAIPPGGTNAVGDVAITRDKELAFVTDFDHYVWVIDLSAGVPKLASGINRIWISNSGEDLALTADEKYLVVTDGTGLQPVSVVDLATRVETSSFATGYSSCAVDVTAAGSVVVISDDGHLERLAINASGDLSATGNKRSLNGTFSNVALAPGGQTGVVIGRTSMAPTHSRTR